MRVWFDANDSARGETLRSWSTATPMIWPQRISPVFCLDRSVDFGGGENGSLLLVIWGKRGYPWTEQSIFHSSR